MAELANPYAVLDVEPDPVFPAPETKDEIPPKPVVMPQQVQLDQMREKLITLQARVKHLGVDKGLEDMCVTIGNRISDLHRLYFKGYPERRKDIIQDTHRLYEPVQEYIDTIEEVKALAAAIYKFGCCSECSPDNWLYAVHGHYCLFSNIDNLPCVHVEDSWKQ